MDHRRAEVGALTSSVIDSQRGDIADDVRGAQVADRALTRALHMQLVLTGGVVSKVTPIIGAASTVPASRAVNEQRQSCIPRSYSFIRSTVVSIVIADASANATNLIAWQHPTEVVLGHDGIPPAIAFVTARVINSSSTCAHRPLTRLQAPARSTQP